MINLLACKKAGKRGAKVWMLYCAKRRFVPTLFNLSSIAAAGYF